MASIVTNNQVLTTSGVPFEGVLRVFPNGSAPLFGAVLHYEFENGFITEFPPSNNFADDEYCFQWIHFATVASAINTPQICEYVATVTGEQEVTTLQTEMLSFYNYVSALTACRSDLMVLMDQVTSLEAQLENCQTQAADTMGVLTSQFQECAEDLALTEGSLAEAQSELEIKNEALLSCQASLQTALEQLEQMTSEEELMVQMAALRAASSGSVRITVPSCNPVPQEPDPEESHELMQRMAGYGKIATESGRASTSSATTQAAAAVAAQLKADKEALTAKLQGIGKRYRPAKPCRTISPAVVNPEPVVPQGTPEPEKVDDIRARIEAMKESCK